MDEKKNITVSFLIGAAIGAGVAYFVSDSGRKKTPELYDYLKKNLEKIADDPQKSFHRAENEVIDKAVDIKDSVNETIESLKTIGGLNIDKLIPRDDQDSVAENNFSPISQNDLEPEIIKPDTDEPVKKPRRFFKRK